MVIFFIISGDTEAPRVLQPQTIRSFLPCVAVTVPALSRHQSPNPSTRWRSHCFPLLDLVRGVDSGVKDCKKSVIKKKTMLTKLVNTIVSSKAILGVVDEV
ncbi:hypothetical protein CFP56_014419 [Quercus suber]|uniref:Uncharacterized protein n=1 Tax=Quercus suber TaxID=58331 RepID=A0AAW0KS17_QUESU